MAPGPVGLAEDELAGRLTGNNGGMAKRSTTEARQRRSEARNRRRSLASRPSEAENEAARGADERGAEDRGDRTLREAVVRAAVGAVAAGIMGAAKALFDRRSEGDKAVREPNAHADEPEATGESEPEAKTETASRKPRPTNANRSPKGRP